jgi:hypothetical protein
VAALGRTADEIRAVRTVQFARRTGELLEGFTVRFDEISDSCRVQLSPRADLANSRSAFGALQLVLPDTTGRWPEDPDYNGFAQPELRD